VNKVNRILLGVLAFQVALVAFVFLRGDDTGIGTLEPLVPGFTGDKVERVRIFDRTSKSATPDPAEPEDEKEDEGDKKGKPGAQPAVDLVKKGENWTLASHFNYPVDAQRVSELLDKVEAMRSRAPIASGKARQKQLEVADDSYQRKVVVTTGGKDVTFYLGASSGQRQTSVRLSGSDEIHGVTGLTAQGVGARASSWVDTAYVDVQAERLASFDVVNESGSFHFEKSDDAWQPSVGGQAVTPPSGMELNKGEIQKLVSRATKIHLSQPADPKRTIDKPLATVTLRLTPEPKEEEADKEGEKAEGEEAVSTLESAGEERIIEIATSDKKDRYYVREKGRDRAVLVDALSVTELVELNRDRLVQKKGAKQEPDPGAMPEGMPPGMPPGAMPPGAMPPGMDPHGGAMPEPGQ
jgi:Domain of unknown function (DUF4340)